MENDKTLQDDQNKESLKQGHASKCIVNAHVTFRMHTVYRLEPDPYVLESCIICTEKLSKNAAVRIA